MLHNQPKIDNLTQIQDGGHVIIKCSNCQKPLVDIWLTYKDEDQETTVVANCPFCQDKSFQQKISGIFHFGAVDGVYIYDVLIDNNITCFDVRKQK